MKLSDLTDEQWFKRLSARRDANRTAARAWWAYYYGEQPLYYVLKILAEQDDRFPALTVNLCEKFIDNIDRRCNVEGFRLNGADTADEDLWKIWQRNDMGEFQSENNVASLVTSASYVAVGPSDEGALITVESPESMAIEIDPRSRRTTASVLFYKSDQESTTDDRAVLQLPGRLVEFENGKPVSGGKVEQDWMAGPRKLQSSPEVPVVRFLNRQVQRQGRSELGSLKPVVDAMNIAATEMMATLHHHAMPRMLAINVAESLFMNDDGTVNREAVKSATGSLWVVPVETDEDDRPIPDMPVPDIKQLPASDLRNFHDTISLLARVGAGLCDMSPHEFGFGVADNPASGDGIKEARVDFTARVERILTSRNTGYGRVMRIAMAVEGKDPATATGLETIFRNPATPTQGTQVDAATKAYGSGLADLHQARVDAGYSATAITAMENRELAAGVAQDQAFNDANRSLVDSAVDPSDP